MSEEKKKVEPKKLPSEVAAKYELTGGHEAGKFLLPGRYGTIDLSQITLQQAAMLTEKKLIPFLKPKVAAPISKTPGQ